MDLVAVPGDGLDQAWRQYKQRCHVLSVDNSPQGLIVFRGWSSRASSQYRAWKWGREAWTPSSKNIEIVIPLNWKIVGTPA